MTTFVPFPSSLLTIVDHPVDMSHENQQFTNAYTFGNNIPSGKADLSAPCMMLKAAFVEKADDEDSDFELVICSRKRSASKVSARDNWIQESVIDPNVAEALSG